MPLNLLGLGRGTGNKGEEPRLEKPPVPSLREMMQDIEGMKKSDQIHTLAAVISQYQGGPRHSISLTNLPQPAELQTLVEAMKKKKRRESHGEGGGGRRRRLSSNSFKEGEEAAEEEGSSEEPAVLSYAKVKQYISVAEHSQEMMGKLEADLKRLQEEVMEHYELSLAEGEEADPYSSKPAEEEDVGAAASSSGRRKKPRTPASSPVPSDSEESTSAKLL